LTSNDVLLCGRLFADTMWLLWLRLDRGWKSAGGTPMLKRMGVGGSSGMANVLPNVVALSFSYADDCDHGSSTFLFVGLGRWSLECSTILMIDNS